MTLTEPGCRKSYKPTISADLIWVVYGHGLKYQHVLKGAVV